MIFKEKIACIYKLTNAATGKIYIGKTLDFHRRMSAHRRSPREKKNLPIVNAIRKHGWDSFSVEILENGSNEYLLERETALILELDSNNPSVGYNILLHAFDRTGILHTEETKTKIGITSKLSALRGDNHPQRKNLNMDIVKAMHAANRGKRRSESTRQLMSERQKGKRREYAEKPVMQMDANTKELIKIWPSKISATRFYSKAKTAANITNCCNFRKNKDGVIQKTAYGFAWKYLDR